MWTANFNQPYPADNYASQYWDNGHLSIDNCGARLLWVNPTTLSLPYCVGWWKVLHRKPKLCTEQFHLWAPTSRQVSRSFVCRAMGWLPCSVEWGVRIWSEGLPNIECLLKPFSLFLCLSEHWARTREGRECRGRREKRENCTSEALRQLFPHALMSAVKFIGASLTSCAFSWWLLPFTICDQRHSMWV